MKEEDVKLEELNTALPSDILNSVEDDDSDMPLPETTDYDAGKKAEESRLLIPTIKFIKLFNECLGKLPYSSILKNSSGDQIKLTDLFKFIEAKTTTGITVKEMNIIISFIASAPHEFVRPFMEIVESAERQQELWSLK